MPDWETNHQIEAALREVEARMAREPGVLGLEFERAKLLAKLGRLQEAKQAYIDLLIKDPNQFPPYINLGVVLNDLGFPKAALKVYREALRRHPNEPAAHLNIAGVLYEVKALAEARGHFETVLRLLPNHGGAHYALSDLLMDEGEEQAAFEHRRKGFKTQPWTTSIYRGDKEPVRIVLLGSPRGGNAPIQKLIDNRIFQSSVIYADFYTEALPIPPHRVVVNLIGDAERCGPSLDAAERFLKQTSAPVLNPPVRIRGTGRAENAQLLGGIEGAVTPRTMNLARELLSGDGAMAALEQHGFVFPVLLRVPGFHKGDFFTRVERAEDLAAAVATLPGQELTVIQYVESRGGDGNFRKFRVMMIDGKLYPLHEAISENWKVHYFSAQMAKSAEFRAEEAAFLEDMAGVLGPRAMRALEQIRDTLALDYGGADFSLAPNGDVLLFEANATMMAPLPDSGAQWDYRRGPVERVYNAVRDMILNRAGAI